MSEEYVRWIDIKYWQGMKRIVVIEVATLFVLFTLASVLAFSAWGSAMTSSSLLIVLLLSGLASLFPILITVKGKKGSPERVGFSSDSLHICYPDQERKAVKFSNIARLRINLQRGGATSIWTYDGESLILGPGLGLPSQFTQGFVNAFKNWISRESDAKLIERTHSILGMKSMELEVSRLYRLYK